MNSVAPQGKIWVCLACGKINRDMAGQRDGWDISCVANCVLCHEDKLEFNEKGRVETIRVGGIVEVPETSTGLKQKMVPECDG